MSDDARPSGATIRVVKTFPNAEDCTKQAGLMRVAGEDISLPLLWTSNNQIAMPLAQPIVGPESYIDLLSVYSALWGLPPQRVATREEYHRYVLFRGSSAGADPVMERALELVGKLYFLVQHIPVRGSVFVHGDSILGNAVRTREGVRLIDFSPRASPPERMIDLSKLWFSSLGFDMSEERGATLQNLLRDLFSVERTDPLFRYYLATHLVRVLSREPPTTVARRDFYKKVLFYVDVQ
jgi:hypothetical protein